MVAKCRATWQHTGNNHCLMPPPKPPAYSGCFLCANTTFVSSGYSSKYELSTTTWNSTFVGHHVATQFGFIINHNFPHPPTPQQHCKIGENRNNIVKVCHIGVDKKLLERMKNRNQFNSDLSDLRSRSSTEVEPLLEKCPINPRLTRSDDDNHNDLGNHDEDANHRHLRFIVMNFAIIAYQYNCYVHHF